MLRNSLHPWFELEGKYYFLIAYSAFSPSFSHSNRFITHENTDMIRKTEIENLKTMGWVIKGH